MPSDLASPPPWLADPAMNLRMDDAARALGDLLCEAHGAGDLVAERVCNDTRVLQPGDAFVALAGARDGHDFVPQAFARGARFGIVARWPLPTTLGSDQGVLVVSDVAAALQRLAMWWRARFTLPVVGIGGGVGKTTTKEITAGLLAVLRGPATILKTPANWNDLRGVSLALLGLRPHHRVAVLEMGMDRPGEVAEIAALGRPRWGVVTSVAATHLEYFPDMASLVATERGLVEALPADGLAILNANDRLVRGMASSGWPAPDRMAGSSVPVFHYGTIPGVDLRGIDVSSRGLVPLSFTAQRGAEMVAVQTTLLGRHLVTNALAALAVAQADGWDLATAAAALASVQVPQRMQILAGHHGNTVIDDTYNASPASMKAALDFLADWPRPMGGRRLAILGTMRELGPRAPREHHRLGRRAAARCDLLFATGEECEQIAAGARAAGIGAVVVAPDPADALRACAAAMRAEDIVLVKASHAVGLDRYLHLLVPTQP